VLIRVYQREKNLVFGTGRVGVQSRESLKRDGFCDKEGGSMLNAGDGVSLSSAVITG